MPLFAAAVVPKLLSYAMPDYQLAGISLTPDDYLLQVALLARNPNWVTPMSLVGTTMPIDLQQRMIALDHIAAQANKEVTTGSVELATSSQSKNATVKSLSESLKTAVTVLAGDVASYNGFIASLATTSGTTTYLAQVLGARAVADKLAGPGVLFVKVHSAAGGLITKKGLTTLFGGMPVYASSGIVVSYVLYQKQPGSELKTIVADFMAVAVPYTKARYVPETIAISQAGNCEKYPRDATAEAVCPPVAITPR